jgi:hypothetical protein
MGTLRAQSQPQRARVLLQPGHRHRDALTSGDDWPGNASGTILPGGFAVYNNKLYILGEFNINVSSTNQIWQFDPTAAVGPSGRKW